MLLFCTREGEKVIVVILKYINWSPCSLLFALPVRASVIVVRSFHSNPQAIGTCSSAVRREHANYVSLCLLFFLESTANFWLRYSCENYCCYLSALRNISIRFWYRLWTAFHRLLTGCIHHAFLFCKHSSTTSFLWSEMKDLTARTHLTNYT